MIVGLGTDLAQISRFEKVLARRGAAFCRRVLTPQELIALENSAQPAAFLAKRFAAKEAALKALGTGLAKGLSWQDLEISNDALGKPNLNFTGAAANLAAQLGVKNAHLSLSDEQDMALAFVVLES